MPCWEVRTQSIDMERIDPAILSAAMGRSGAWSMGFADGVVWGRIKGVSYRWEAGKLSLAGESEALNLEVAGIIKRAYTAEAFRAAAARSGFTVKQTADGKLQAVRVRIGG